MADDKKTNTPQEYTPITGKPIPQVQTERWNEMSASDLWDQRAILMQRLSYAHQVGSSTMIKQLTIGIEFLDNLIDSKSGGSDTRLL